MSFLAPVVGEGIGFLRILRTLRLLQTYQLLARPAGRQLPFFRRNEDLIIASVNLGVFIFIMTGFVYETQRWTNTKIGNYIDALYFTIAALTTTGFGDITLTGTLGHLISVIIMICGVTLFLRLVQVLLRPDKVRFPVPSAACSGMTGMRFTARPAAPPSTFPTKARSDDHASGMMATPRCVAKEMATGVPGAIGCLRPYCTTNRFPMGLSTSYSICVPR